MVCGGKRYRRLELKILSRNGIESIAERVLKAYMGLPEFAGNTIYRIEPEILIEKVLGLNIDYQYLSDDGSILGLTSFCEMGIQVYENDDSEAFYFLDGKTVLVDKRLKEDITLKGRCNFTAVHEAGHQILKMLYPKEYGNTQAKRLHFYRMDSEIKKPIADWEEWQANTLGAAILLPKQLVKQAMEIFGLGERMRLLNKIYAPRDYEKFCAMADFLGVSKTALAIRLKYFGMLEMDYLRNPHEFLDVTYEGGK